MTLDGEVLGGVVTIATGNRFSLAITTLPPTQQWRKGSGVDERDGLVWAGGFPLSAGTNQLTLTMTDAADNGSVTNLSVVKSTVLLAIGDSSGADFN